MAEGGVGVGEPLRLVAAVVELGDGAAALGLKSVDVGAARGEEG